MHSTGFRGRKRNCFEDKTINLIKFLQNLLKRTYQLLVPIIVYGPSLGSSRDVNFSYDTARRIRPYTAHTTSQTGMKSASVPMVYLWAFSFRLLT